MAQGLALGVLHGPAELLPISSSGHTTALPWLVGSDYPGLDVELRKALEVALHAGAAAALLAGRHRELADELRSLDRRRAVFLGLGSVPAGLAGWWLERVIEERFGTPTTVAAGLVAGGAFMAWADRAGARRSAPDAGVADALWLGLAQAGALIPGVSRNGATLAAARARGFTRDAAERLSRQLAYPVIAGAALLKTRRLVAGGRRQPAAVPLAAGALASFTSTLLVDRALGDRLRGRPLLPYALYRMGLALAILARGRRELGQVAHRQGHTGSM